LPSLILIPIATTIAVALLLVSPSQPAASAPSADGEQFPPQRQGLRTIVIDPGHGGQATGTIAAGGLAEKTVTLDIAIRLRELVYRRLGLQVKLTREADVDLENVRRTEMANNWEADLFISIHANGFRQTAVRGPETYFLSASASDANARRAAQRENGADTTADAATTAPPPGLDFILWDLAQTQHLRESSLFAEGIQAALNGLWRIPDRGVKQAPFTVLRGATMPAVLVEVGYLSNAEDAAMLADPDVRQRIAESLFRGISAFREQYAVLAGAPPN
jgi:N-acetylmuramoyl-L-alanine amidase